MEQNCTRDIAVKRGLTEGPTSTKPMKLPSRNDENVISTKPENICSFEVGFVLRCFGISLEIQKAFNSGLAFQTRFGGQDESGGRCQWLGLAECAGSWDDHGVVQEPNYQTDEHQNQVMGGEKAVREDGIERTGGKQSQSICRRTVF